LSDEAVLKRHRECRGKALCAVDGEPGIAPHNTFRLFEQPPERYPFHLTRDMAEPSAFWREMTQLSLWALERLGRGQLVLDAIQWVAQVDAALADRVDGSPGGQGRPQPVDLWRYHACTLLMSLEGRLESGEAEVIAALPRSIGAGNMAAFRRVFDRLDSADGLFQGVSSLVDAACAADGRSAVRRRALIREIVHATLIQLQQPVMHHVPLVLFAWHRRAAQPTLPRAAAAGVRA
ncbi:MAG: hypothetical protein AAFX50_08415, partial [Acidobacteriota bacterium]